MIKAIETSYRGYRFRSRLEARWAVFFDTLGITWEYEPEGFELPGGVRYLPDFFLPKFNHVDGLGMYVEVKPSTDSNFSKPRALVTATGREVLLAVGPPDFRVYTVLTSPGIVEIEDLDSYDACFVARYINPRSLGDGYRLYACPGYENQDGSIHEDYFDDFVATAIRVSRSARFEFGESGARA